MHRKIILWFTLSIVYALTLTRILEINQDLDFHTVASFNDMQQIPSERWIGESDVIDNTISMSLGSRKRLEEALDMEIHTLAYPYGLYNSEVADSALIYGYYTSMGLGSYVNHGSYSLYYLNRQPVDGLDAMEEFNSVCERSASS